jgi:hypothetical protein
MTMLDTPIYRWANAIIDPDTGASMEYWHLIKRTKHEKDWKGSFSNELVGCLSQGIGEREIGTSTI